MNTDTIRVACLSQGGSTLTMPARAVIEALGWVDDRDDGPYTLTFRDMPVEEYEALHEFEGF